MELWVSWLVSWDDTQLSFVGVYQRLGELCLKVDCKNIGNLIFRIFVMPLQYYTVEELVISQRGDAVCSLRQLKWTWCLDTNFITFVFGEPNFLSSFWKAENPTYRLTAWSNCNNMSFESSDLTLLSRYSCLRGDLFLTYLQITSYGLCLSSVRATCFADLISFNFIMYINY